MAEPCLNTDGSFCWAYWRRLVIPIELFNYSLVPLISATVLTIVLLAPIVPLYVAILAVILVVYVVAVWLLFRRTLPLNALAASAQNRLSGGAFGQHHQHSGCQDIRKRSL